MRSMHLAGAVHGEGLPSPGQQRELGHELLGELVGPIHVVAAGDDAWQLVGGHVRLHHHLCSAAQQPMSALPRMTSEVY